MRKGVHIGYDVSTTEALQPMIVARSGIIPSPFCDSAESVMLRMFFFHPSLSISERNA